MGNRVSRWRAAMALGRSGGTRMTRGTRQANWKRREFIASLVSTITAWSFAGLAQTASRVYRFGILSTDGPADAKSIFDAMLQALASHGYVPDRNMALEIRASGIHTEQLPQLAKDLVASNVDVILTFSFPAAMAAKNATTTIPIVSVNRTILTKLSRAWCAIHRMHFSWSRMRSLA